MPACPDPTRFPVEVAVRTVPEVTSVPVRRRWSVFSIIGVIVVVLVAVVVIYFAWVGWVNKGKPVPDVDLQTSALDTSTARTSAATGPSGS